MRAALGLWLVVLAAAGCTSGSASPPDPPGTHRPSAEVQANGRTACLAVRKASTTYSAGILSASNGQLTAKTRQWSTAISKAARDVMDTTLRIQLLSLADVVRTWADRPPDKAAMSGFQNDMQSACRPFLNSVS
jgi:hypothetical protein